MRQIKIVINSVIITTADGKSRKAKFSRHIPLFMTSNPLRIAVYRFTEMELRPHSGTSLQLSYVEDDSKSWKKFVREKWANISRISMMNS